MGPLTMTDTLFSKNVVLEDWINFKKTPVEEGLELISRRSDNNENYCTVTGTKQQINTYLEKAPIISERLRTLNNIPKYRIINTTKVIIQ